MYTCRCMETVIRWLVCGSYGNTPQCTGGGGHCMSNRTTLLGDADPLYPAHYTCGSHDEQLLCRGNGNLAGAPVSGRDDEVGDVL